MTIPPRIAALETNGDTTTTNDDDIAFCSSSVRSRVEQRRKRKACSDRVNKEKKSGEMLTGFLVKKKHESCKNEYLCSY